MSSETDDAAWDIIVSRLDGSGKRMYNLPVSCLVSEVCSRWREEVEESEEGAFFTQGHVLIRPEQTVGDIGDTQLETAKLLFEQTVAPTCDVIVTESGGRRRHYTLSIVSPVRDVFTCWCEDSGETRGRFLTPDGNDVSMEQQIGLVHAFSADMLVLRLLFERHVDLQIEVCGVTRSVEVGLSQTPAVVWPMIGRAFGLQEERHFQLRSHERVLDSSLSFSAQEVRPGDSLSLDLGLDLNFHHAWENLNVQMEDVFATDDCREVFQEMQAVIREKLKVKRQREEPVPVEEQPSDPDFPPWLRERLQLLAIAYADSCHSSESSDEEEDAEVTIRASDAALLFNGPVGDALAALGAPRRRCFDLRVEQKRMVSLLDGSRIQQTEVWPSQSVIDVAPHPLIDQDGKLARDRFEEILVPDNGLLVVRPLFLYLQFSDGQRHGVRLAPAATVGDLRRIACGSERQNFVHLSCGEQTLVNDDCALGRAGLVDGDSVLVRRSDLEMTVTVHGQTVSWWPKRERIDLNEVVMKLSKFTQSTVEEVRGWTLRCVGCDRRMRKDSVIPVDCCGARSTQLTETAPELYTDADSILTIRKLEKQNTSLLLSIKKVLEEKESLESNKQQLLREQVQSNIRYLKLLTEKRELENTDLLITEKNKLQQLNRLLTTDDRTITKLMTDVLREKEKLRKTKADLLKEKKRQSKENNDLLIEKERLEMQNTELQKDNTQLKLWKVILDEVNDQSSADRLFLIQKENGDTIPRVSLMLPAAPTTAQVRTQVALMMGWRTEETLLGRRMGLVGEGRVFLAKDGDGKCLSDCFFADVTGNVYKHSLVKDWEREDLRDDSDHFPLIRKFVNVVRVARRRR